MAADFLTSYDIAHRLGRSWTALFRQYKHYRDEGHQLTPHRVPGRGRLTYFPREQAEAFIRWYHSPRPVEYRQPYEDGGVD